MSDSMSDSMSSGEGANPSHPAGHGSAPHGADLPQVEAPALAPDPPETAEAASPEPPCADAAAPAKPACGTALVLAHPQPQAETAERVADQLSARSSTRFAPSFGTLAAMLAGAAILGGAVGALAMAGVLRAESSSASAYSAGLAEALGRLDRELTQFKAGTENKASSGETARLAERLDRAEKAQAESSLKLARAGEALDRLERRFAAVPVSPTAPAPANAQGDVTGAIADTHGPNVAMSGDGRRIASLPNATVPGTNLPLPALPVLEGWVLRDVYRGTALIQGRAGILPVMAGDNLPGLGRIEAVQRRDGRWVVVTSRGLIVSRSSF
jgi:hypothetical protein